MGKRYPLKAVRTLKEREREVEEEENISLRQNLLGSIRPFPEPIQYLLRGESLSYGKPLKRRRINQRRDSSKRIEPGKVRFCFFTTSQTRFPQGELISGLAAIYRG